MAFSIEDVNSRTILQQFHSLYKKQEQTEEDVASLDQDLKQEIQDRTNADIGLSEQIGALQSQLDSLGTIFTLKGSVATVDDLPSENNHVGDVWYVQSVSSGYIWIDDDGTERWEQLGLSVDMSNYPTNEDLDDALETKQDKLTAGTNISIIDNVISAAGGNNNAVLLDTSEQTFLGAKKLGLSTHNEFLKFGKTGTTANVGVGSKRISGTIDDMGVFRAYNRYNNQIYTDFSDKYITIKKPSGEVNLKIPDYPDITTNLSKTLATTDDIKSLYQHKIDLYKSNEFSIHFVVYNNSSTQLTSSDLSSICPIGVSGFVVVNSKYCTVTMIQWSYQLVASYIKDDLSGVDNAFCGTTFTMTDTVTQIL